MSKLSWKDIDSFKDAEISYMLYMEGKDINCISKIRCRDRLEIEKHIIECRVKYRIFEGNNSTEDLVKRLIKCRKEERLNALQIMDADEIKKLEKHCIKNLFSCSRDECIFYIWLLGEIRSKEAVGSLITFLRCTDGNIKRLCCSALGKIGDLKAEDSLIQCLGDKRQQIREYAIKSLGKLRSKKSIVQLRLIVENDRELDYIKRAARESMELIEGKCQDFE